MSRLSTACALVLMYATAAWAEPAAIAPERYIVSLLEHRYQNPDASPPISEAYPYLYDAQLARLLAADPQTGEGVIDFDPVCDCQDFDISTITVRSIKSTETTALVEASFVNSGTPVRIQYKLRLVGGYWLISDIVFPGRGSLLANLKNNQR